MNILAIVGLAILTAVLATLMRRYHKEYAMLLSVLGGGLILFMIFQNFTPALSSITDMLSASGVSGEYTIILIKTFFGAVCSRCLPRCRRIFFGIKSRTCRKSCGYFNGIAIV